MGYSTSKPLVLKGISTINTLGLLDTELVLLGYSTSEPLVLKGTSTINTLGLLDADILGNCLRTTEHLGLMAPRISGPGKKDYRTLGLSNL